MELENIVLEFLPHQKVLSITAIDKGLINKTFVVETMSGKYLLQSINTGIFKNSEAIVKNHLTINSILKQNHYEAEIAEPIETKSKTWLYKNEEAYWRMSTFLDNSNTYLSVENTSLAYKAVEAFSYFYSIINQNENLELKPVLPDFINFEKRISDFKKALERTTVERKDKAKNEIEFILKHLQLPNNWIALEKENKLPNRIIHADPKISNILFDNEQNVKAIIDLDTMMNGTLLYDFGDMIRSYTNLSNEDDGKTKNNFSPEIFDAVKKAFLKHLENKLTKTELDNLDDAAKVVIYIQAVRFLTDFLNGNIYYSVQYPEHNLDRTRNQINLLIGLSNHLEA
ncbi:aminoglycoside phosphotransferase family protein [Soonwooa sp.]|uniref:phosphotransferase enzyme family protein n=1 Tax=Soonwooa sp. TaxID=1938592 RepID=UPI002607307B|nr:aminoglycoside phosphotransferase family protein [Soonwooa sp.]